MVRTLRLNGTKVTLRNAFIDNLFALESEKELQKTERTHFSECLRIVYVFVNAYTPNTTYMWFSRLFQF